MGVSPLKKLATMVLYLAVESTAEKLGNIGDQMWNLQKSASDSARILSKMALKDTDLWCLTAF